MKTEELMNVDKEFLPKHIAIIMDGNGRWAKAKGMPRHYGHYEGANRVVDIVRASSNLGIEVLTLYAFSTENWKRPAIEVNAIMKILIKFIDDKLDELAANNVIIKVLGNREPFPKDVMASLEKAIKKTENNTGMILNIALNYGGQQEIIQAVNKAIQNGKEVDIDDFKSYLYTENQIDVDFLIRTSGELRLSNFLLFQSAYAELYFTSVLWPDFNEEELYKAIEDYLSRNRRFGGL
ncbi:MAG: isoprenyl transferase [Tissierellia bacterium]|nr:isoprenyl transferase [Tissierellia bacterium]